ncbi:hypothetical protein ERO13_A01G130811v2 [Gossypium hirsutum]|uniref:Uncharacterized protein LOC107918150 isoform X1 n=4 Tax=Gossypium TaxID=3633 RepID=A0A1U8KQ90_GOSHI|nr:uncharacterized protein LOC107918150 isoform X1 [Gossypium hirsutum]XP_016703169.1 uncharacterized protein LOC107918150 isoform X1 [Gossypium hirsutum]XP_040967074.1 uncharacterized protein LOC107918150 isoform X1 [Gossypium hirsutum]KAB2096892.1 hypothetical protein ES319_A01G134700v1 [Gossypium barbadense]KAB2096894.1 hypothetical protein ES319_A01G134700v1 [Gossypium barbadense]KAG4214608.1 hypothetical protein ERO13_A01G130811v2 [Gossypium hirsutum]
MAFDLWGTSFTEEENSPFIQPEWPYDFYFGYGIDMIEENALNEKSCIQVLRILIAKADTEIDELEKDLVLLQSELVWAEHEEWHDICCSALRAKINCLDISIRKLRNKDENDIEVYLLMHTEPVEKLHEIMKALLKSFYNEKHEQNEQSQDVVPDSRSGSLEQSAALHKNQKLNSSDSCFIAKEENNGPNVTPKENFTSSNPSMELEVKKANSSETLANADVKDLMPHFLLPAAGQFDEKSIITLLDLETTKKLKESGRALKDKNVVQHFSLKSAQKRKNNLYRTKVKDAAAQCVNDSDLDASKHSAGRLNKKKKTSSSSLKIVSEEATMHTSISAADMLILDSSSNSTGMTGDLTKKVKEEQTADIIANDLGLIAHKQMIGDSSEMKTLGKHDVKINGCEVQGQDTSNFSNSCLNPEHEGNIQNADKVESLKFDMDQKLCDFAVKSARKQRTKESKVASMDKNQHSNSLLKGEEKRNDTLQDVTPKEASPSDNEHSALTSLVEPQDENGEDKTIQLMEEKSQMEEVPMSEVVSSDGKLVTNLYMRLQRGKVKTVKPNMESTAADAEESGLNSMENLSNSSPFPKGKRTWKNTNNCSLNYSLTGKIIKKTVQHSQCEAEGTSLMLDASQNTMPLPQKKCKKLSSVPIVVEFRASSVQMNISKLHGDLNKSNIVKTEFAESGALVDDLGAKGVVPWPLDASSLMKMKLRDLRAIAKSQKLKKYSTMKKEDLVKRLENGLSC